MYSLATLTRLCGVLYDILIDGFVCDKSILSLSQSCYHSAEEGKGWLFNINYILAYMYRYLYIYYYLNYE